MESDVDPPAVTEVEPKVAVAPAGTPDAVRFTVWAAPAVTAVETVVPALVPAVTDCDVGLSLIEKSLVGGGGGGPPVTTGWEMAQPFVSLDQVDCMANVPVPIETLAAPPAVPGVSQAH